MLSLNVEKCRAIAKTIRSLTIDEDFYKRRFLSFNADRETKLRLYLMSTAICHQTHALHHKNLNLWGWEYMEHVFLKMLNDGAAFFNPGYIDICSPEEIKSILISAFSPDGSELACTLDRLNERAAMLQEICSVLITDYASKVSILIDGSGGKLLDNGKGLYEVLSQFSAFSDKYRKKISFFLKLVVDAKMIQIRDPQNLIPIMDYHMQRVLLRMGCIDFNDPGFKQLLIDKTKMASDEQVRALCIEALNIIGKESGHSILKLNDFFWPLGRSCCNVYTRCKDGVCSKTPCTFQEMLALRKHEGCEFEDVCLGYIDESFRSLWEPMVDTHYY